jgi:hypothetical protein
VDGRKMFARITVPSLIVIGTSHMLTLACALGTANPARSRARGRARGSAFSGPPALVSGWVRLMRRRALPLRRPCSLAVAVRKRIILISLPLAEPGSGVSQYKNRAKLPEQNGEMSQKLDII